MSTLTNVILILVAAALIIEAAGVAADALDLDNEKQHDEHDGGLPL